jgi:tripartite motif-containing protein 71
MNPRMVLNMLFMAFALTLSACGGSEPTTAPVTTAFETLTPSPTTEPTIEPTPSPGGPVQFLWSVTGDSTPFANPSDVDLDSLGNLYVVDTLNHRIIILDGNGNFTAAWGGQGTEEGQFNFAWKENLTADESDEVAAGVALDSADNVYVADVGNARIQKFDSSGGFLMQWGTVGPDAGISQPYDLVVDNEGNVYTIDLAFHITKYDSAGNFVLRWGGEGRGDGLFVSPGFLAMDQEDNLYVTDSQGSSIQKFDSGGQFLAKIPVPVKEGGDSRFSTPYGIALDAGGYIYVTDYLSNRIVVLDANGEFQFDFGSQGADEGRFYGPADLAVDTKGNIYISEIYNNRVQKFLLAQ